MKKQNPSYSLLFAITLGINAVIGAGIFTMPISLFKSAGPASILSIILGSICILFIGLSLARISFLIPEEGGFYTYINAWAGKIWGAIASLLYLIGLTMALGILTKYVSGVISLYAIGINISYINYTIIIGSFIATLFAASIAQVGQFILFILTLLPIIFIGCLCLKNFSIQNFNPFFSEGIIGVLKGIPGVIFSFLGFEAICLMTRVVKNPKQNIPIATIVTIIVAAISYTFFVGSVIGSINKNLLIHKSNLSEVLLFAFPSINWIVNFINISIIITILGTIYAIQLSLAELFIGFISKVSEKKLIPSETFSALIISISTLIFSKLINNIGIGFSIVSIFIVSVYALTTLYLLIKPKGFLDYFLGIFGMIANIILIGSAILQLI